MKNHVYTHEANVWVLSRFDRDGHVQQMLWAPISPQQMGQWLIAEARPVLCSLIVLIN